MSYNYPHRIAIAGRAHSGKSTLAKALQTYFAEVEGVTIPVHSFAEPLKAGCEAMGLLSFPGPEGRMIKRKALQSVGDTVRREIGDDYWVNLFEKQHHDEIISSGIIIDDIRYPNELLWAASHGFVIVSTIASERTRAQWIYESGMFPSFDDAVKAVDEASGHVSEQLPLTDHNIDVVCMPWESIPRRVRRVVDVVYRRYGISRHDHDERDVHGQAD